MTTPLLTLSRPTLAGCGESPPEDWNEGGVGLWGLEGRRRSVFGRRVPGEDE